MFSPIKRFSFTLKVVFHISKHHRKLNIYNEIPKDNNSIKVVREKDTFNLGVKERRINMIEK